MALYPAATLRLITPGGNDPRLDVTVGAILHVDAGNVRDLHDYFNGPSGGIESHFQIAKDGKVFQYRDTAWEADANFKANSWIADDGQRKGFISIETQGLEHGRWTQKQMAAIKRLLTWLSEEHDFPLRVTPGPRSRGVGYHTLFGAPGPWTPVSKSCPGPDRKKQFHDELVPWFTAPSGKPDEGDPGPKVYVVRAGDTMTAIAKRYDSTVEAFMTANTKVKNADFIVPGQHLNVPTAKQSAAKPKPAPKKAPAKPEPNLPPTVRRGSKGEAVATLQRFLGVKGPGLGTFGPRTNRAVRRYQKRQRLVVDGIVGTETWTRILSALKYPPYHA